jgi:SpoVK/Ycf46/Vps4 family AAA+-type ATPase
LPPLVRALDHPPHPATLFAGPSGTGKTMAAEVLARELASTSTASTSPVWSASTSARPRRTWGLRRRRAGGAILFFDEADALFGKRTEVRDSHDRYANIEVSYLLQRMEDYRASPSSPPTASRRPGQGLPAAPALRRR